MSINGVEDLEPGPGEESFGRESISVTVMHQSDIEIDEDAECSHCNENESDFTLKLDPYTLLPLCEECIKNSFDIDGEGFEVSHPPPISIRMESSND